MLAGESAAEALRRITLAQTDLALTELSVRLLEGELGNKLCTREDDALRRAAEGLSGMRDAEVMLATLERLIERHPRKLGPRTGIARMRRRLADERDAARRRMLEDTTALAECTGELRAFRARAAAWSLSPEPGLGGAAAGLRRIYAQGRRRGRRAAKASSRRRTRALHRWRKRVKDLRYAVEMLERAQGGLRAQGGPRAQGAPRAQGGPDLQGGPDVMAEIAARADHLGETLGEDHDLAVLAEWVRVHGKRAGAGSGARRQLLSRISRRRRKLRRRAFEQGRRLYRRPPKKFLARVRRAYERDAPRVS